jgi:hypothetical protein
MRRIVLSVVGVTAAATLIGSTVSDAATTNPDLSITGSTVAGVTGAQPNQELAFSFVIKNNSTTTSATADFKYTITNGIADRADYICPLSRNHYNVYAEVPFCETGSLGPGKTAQGAVLVETQVYGTMTVKACAVNEAATDPVSSNNCKTLAVKVG